MSSSFFFSQPTTLFSSRQHTPTHWINSIELFIAQSHDRKHIVLYLLGLVACSACIVASFWVEAAVQALWMNWVSARGWEMALIPLWCHSRDKEKRGSIMRPPIHSSVSLSPRRAHPWFSCPVMGSYYRPVTYTPPPHPHTQSPLTHPGCSHAIFPSTTLPCSALSVPTPIDFGPSCKIPISHPRSGAQGKKAANLVHVCVCVFICVSLTA